MPSHHGSFCWYELMTTDLSAAEAFYTQVVGWQAQDSGHPDMRYTLLLAGEMRVAGMMTLPQTARDAGAPPHWIGYVAVDNVDASTALAQQLGGSVVHGPTDIPAIGRFALIRDPQGAAICLFHGMGETTVPPAIPTEPGYVGWRELYTTDLEAGLAFYATLFGWTKSTTMDMGPMGIYQLFAHGGVDIGGMMTKPPMVPVSAWGFYVEVDAISAAIGRIQTSGGGVINGPHQVPTGQWIVQASDPQRAVFALVSRAA